MPQSEWENLASLLSIAAAIIALVVMLALGGSIQPIFTRTEKSFRHLAAARSFCFVLIPAISFLLNIAITLHRGIPKPIIHDEFSYLLAGDTFAHGRLTNPQPPFWEHFETPQELVRPTRMSKYPPGQGLFIALGQVMSGLPIVGIWISTAAACAAIYWMLLGFVSRPGALLGGLISATGPVLLDWSQVYWGGCVAVLGGALLLGGWGRLMIRGWASASVMMAIGLAVLANSRPFEGLIVSIPLLIALLIHARHQLFQMMIPAVIVLGLTAAWMGYDNDRVTGNPLRMPFAEYTAQYDVYPKFWFQPVRPTPQYHNRSQEWVHTDFEQGQYDQLRTLRGFFGIARLRVGGLISHNLKLAALFIPFAVSFSLLRDRRVRWVFLSVAFLLVGLLAENFDLPHYSSPATAALLLLTVMGMAAMWNSSFGNGTLGIRRWPFKFQFQMPNAHRPTSTPGKWATIALMIGYLTGTAMCISQGLPPDSRIVQQTTLVDLESELHTGRHLIFVNYGPNSRLINGFANEFVYNPADLDGSRIIWARYLGPGDDRPVAQHFSGRSVWLLDIQGRLILKRYPEQP